jgi:hypothetical protein
MFGIGRIREKAVVRAFGRPDELAATLTIPAPAAPPVVGAPSGAAPCPADADEDVRAGVPPSAIDLTATLAGLPPIAPRDWHPSEDTERGDDAADLLRNAGLDPEEPLALVEVAVGRPARAGEGA